jgi:hypothetical protein
MATAWVAAHDHRIVEVRISFQRPDSLSENDMRTWINQRLASGRPAIALGQRDGTENHGLLTATVPSRSRASDDQIADLIMDMHLLGLRPSVVSDPDVDQDG